MQLRQKIKLSGLILIISILLIGQSLAINLQMTGSATVPIGDARVLKVTNGTPPYTWTITTVNGNPGILNKYSGSTVCFIASVNTGACYIRVTDSTAQTLSTGTILVVPTPSPLKSFWLQGTQITTISSASTIITTSTTHQVRDVYFLVKGGSGTISTTKLFWLTQIAKDLKTNVRIHPWIICFSDATQSDNYPTVGTNWIDSRSTAYQNYLMASTFVPILRDNPDIAGIHLDCYRYPGNAYSYDTGLALVKFLGDIATTVNNYHPGIPISIAVMPETSGNEYYYGQNYYKLSTAGCRVICPMSYSGNYGASAGWVGQVTKYVRDTVGPNCSIYAGIQLSYDTGGYMNGPRVALETKFAVDSGAQGVCGFRYPVQSYQWDAWDTVGQATTISFYPANTVNMVIGQSTIFRATDGWYPYAKWTTTNWSIGSVSIFYGDNSAKFHALSNGTCKLLITDSAPAPNTVQSLPIQIQSTAVELWEFEAISGIVPLSNKMEERT